MSLTNAERQANYKKKREDLLQSLTAQNEALIAENAQLQSELKALTEKCHKLEIASLKAQLRQGAGAARPKR